jgi:hypothetical protein
MENQNNFYGMWIAPDGNFWDVPNNSGHEDIARQITGGFFYNPEKDNLPETKYLIASGFCRVIFEKTEVSIEYVKLTKYQREFLEMWKDENLSIREQQDLISWEDFKEHANKKYNFVPLRKFTKKIDI